jgi:hypothetical protein
MSKEIGHDERTTTPDLTDGAFESPTEDELKSLRWVSDRLPLKAFAIAIVELIERLSYYGAVAVSHCNGFKVAFCCNLTSS